MRNCKPSAVQAGDSVGETHILGGQSNLRFRAQIGIKQAFHSCMHTTLVGKRMAAVCHGPRLLIDADVVRNRKVMLFPSNKADLIHAGAQWSDQLAVTDNGLVTRRRPSDIPRFNEKMIEEFAEGKHQKLAAKTASD